MPKLLGEAVVATEDRRFYSHGGVDWYGTARAAVSNLVGHGGRQGGSSITQQLARNSIGRMERTYNRKLLEIFLAGRIERAYTKEQILRYYLDRIYFGQGLYGAQTTAYAFFGVPVQQLNLAQCALLAGMISSPNASSPWKDIKAAKAARDRALERMVRAKYITEAEAEHAHRAPLALRPRPDFGGGFATSEVRRQLEQILDETTIEQGGLKISTTIDPRLQLAAENSLQARINEIEASKGETHRAGFGDPNTGLPDSDVLEGAFFAMDPGTGAIRAVVGSRDFALSQYNRAVQARRQIGSTLKPLIYATAFAERNYSPASTIDATPFDLTKAQIGPATGPRNILRVNDALVHSDNYAARRMGEVVGPALLNDYAHRCGVTTDIPPFPSSYLGVLRHEPQRTDRHLRHLRRRGRLGPATHRRARARRQGPGDLPVPARGPSRLFAAGRAADHRHAPERARFRHRRARPHGIWLFRRPPPARPARPTITRTPGSRVSPPIWSRASGSATTRRVR